MGGGDQFLQRVLLKGDKEKNWPGYPSSEWGEITKLSARKSLCRSYDAVAHK